MTESYGQPEKGLPPKKARLYDVEKKGKIETPYDDFNRVHLDGLIEVGQRTVASDYDWSAESTGLADNIHHLQWFARWYKYGLRHDFRELNSRQVTIPRALHNWLHHLTEAPRVPERDVMYQTVKAERIALKVGQTAKRASETLNWPKGVKKYNRLGELLDEYGENCEKAAQVPPEFQLVTPDQIEANTVSQMIKRNELFGRLALDSIPSRVEQVVNRLD